MCGLGMEVVPLAPVTGGWGMKRDTGTSKAIYDILRQMLNLSASKHRLHLMCLLVLGKRY